ncbi:hypothetical protein ARALYDRAFT_912597 [Arabidopsis lyrata subsp. lyrata]|uniref:MADS-box domain-containing protein n=1 Tax=Arabidopsis lyrata subsp. lyrata TaxID=81972 RepID=D7MAM5_ARALL|nr:hypothetical protein ARALYDRAFT_912597 [Arabidopsis lyrata subsp. lyrata]
MGRVKIQIKRINDRQQRNIAFAKRKNGLLKKAYELFILCNVPVALILFSPSGKLFVFYAKARYMYINIVSLPKQITFSLSSSSFNSNILLFHHISSINCFVINLI